MENLVKTDRIEEILSLSQGIRQDFLGALSKALRIGQLLVEQRKEMLLTGESFPEWLDRYITSEDIGRSTCYHYMELWRDQEKIDPRLSIRDNIKLLESIHGQEREEKERQRQDAIDLWLSTGEKKDWDRTTYRRADDFVTSNVLDVTKPGTPDLLIEEVFRLPDDAPVDKSFRPIEDSTDRMPLAKTKITVLMITDMRLNAICALNEENLGEALDRVVKFYCEMNGIKV